jgi:acetyl-CoA C-acetyltransferase
MVTPSSASDIVIVGGARTPFGKLNGSLAALTAVDLASHAIREALVRSRVPAEMVDTVLLGQVIQAGSGQGPARQAAVAAGIGWEVPATTINKICLSGLTAIIDAARMIRCGDAEVIVAGGTESMSNGPHLLPRSRRGWTYGDFMALDSVAHDGLTDAFDEVSMGASTERSVSALGISRTAQDTVAAASHANAAKAVANGIFDTEIAPIPVPQRKGDPVLVEVDEGIRGETSVESLGRLRPAFASDGTITAGNSSPLSDGAAAVIVTTRALADQHGWVPLAVVGAYGQVAGPDNSLPSQPARAIARALDRGGLTVAEVDFLEINEAFGAVVAQSLAELDYPADQTNLHGGAIALGHPLGASGTRLAWHAALELSRRGSGAAVVGLCGGGGQGEALVLLSA